MGQNRPSGVSLSALDPTGCSNIRYSCYLTTRTFAFTELVSLGPFEVLLPTWDPLSINDHLVPVSTNLWACYPVTLLQEERIIAITFEQYER